MSQRTRLFLVAVIIVIMMTVTWGCKPPEHDLGVGVPIPFTQNVVVDGNIHDCAGQPGIPFTHNCVIGEE